MLFRGAIVSKVWQFGIAVFVLVLGVVYGVGALDFPADTGYAGISARFFPTLVAVALVIAGVLLLWQVARGGLRNFTDGLADAAVNLRGGLWVSAGVLLYALLITRIGFVLAATLLFVFVARGFGSRRWWRDLVFGLALVLPVFWLFTLVLDVSLPHLLNDWI